MISLGSSPQFIRNLSRRGTANGAGVAHEVLNPLASISSVAQIIRGQLDQPDQVGQLDLILEEIGRVTKIVRDLQAFSRPDDREAPINVDLHAALDHAVTLASYDKRAENVAITRDFAADPAVVRGSVDRLLIVLTNILINALDAASDPAVDRGEIRVSTSGEGDAVEVSVTDNGPGMTEEQIARAFEPFFTTKPPGAGTGLGLWISHQVVEAHGGSIKIESLLGKNTTLKLRLPRYEIDEALASTR